MEQSYNLRSPAVKRLMREAKELKDKTEQFSAHPLEDNLFEWHFTIRGPVDTEFENGLYHGRIVLPPDYPMKPPSIILLTPSGRFEVNRKICLSISGYHPETWQPSWSLRTALLGIIGFMPSHGNGAIGSLDYTPDERRVLAKKSQDWKCPQCGPICNLVLPVTELSKKLNAEAKELGLQIKMQGEKTKTTESSETPPTTAATAVTRTTPSVAAPTSTSASGPSLPAQNLQTPLQQQFFTVAAAQLTQQPTFPNIPPPSFAFPYFGAAPPSNSTPSQLPISPLMPQQFPMSFLPPPPLLPPFFCPPFPAPPLMTHETPGTTTTQQNVYGMTSYPFYMNPMFNSPDFYRQWPFPTTAAVTSATITSTAAATAASPGTTITTTISAATTSVISSTAKNNASSTLISVPTSITRMSTAASAGGVVVSSSVASTTAAAATNMTTAKMTSTSEPVAVSTVATATTASASKLVTKTTNVFLTSSSTRAVTATSATIAAAVNTITQSSSKLNEENKSTPSPTATTSTTAATFPPPTTTSASTTSTFEASGSSNLRQRKQDQSTSTASTPPTNDSTPAAAARPIRTQRRSARLLSGPIRMFAAGLLDFFIIIIAFAIFGLIGLRMLWMI